MQQIFADIAADIFPKTVLPYHVMIARIIGALILVSVIGAEREARGRPAGLRTHMLVALAAVLFGILAGEVARAPVFDTDQSQVDPLRVVEAVTSGVAFIAAGFIVFAKGEVKGLTTGAGIWLASAIGLTVGFGFWIIAIFATVIGTAVLMALYRVEQWLDWK